MKITFVVAVSILFGSAAIAGDSSNETYLFLVKPKGLEQVAKFKTLKACDKAIEVLAEELSKRKNTSKLVCVPSE